MAGDRTGARVRERTWVEKFDHSGEKPELVDTVFVESEGSLHGEETEGQGTAGAAEAADVEGQDGHEGRGRRAQVTLDPWKSVATIVRAAQETGIEVERALKFMALVAAETRPGLAKQPERKQ